MSDIWRNRITGHEDVPPDQLLANPYNWRLHVQAQQEAVAGSLDELGWIDDVTVNTVTGHVLDGHLRVTLALRRDEPTVPVKYVELSEEEEKLALSVYDPTTAMAVADREKLGALLQGVRTGDSRLQQMLSDLAEREGVVFGGNGQPPEPPEPQTDKAEELREAWGVELGQVWELGEHRLVCGDCTDPTVVEAVMRGERARMIFSDPPYGIGKDIENDNLRKDEWLSFYQRWTDVALEHVIENGYVYVWGYFETLSDYWQEVIKPRQDCNFRNFIIWQKTFIQGQNAPDFRQFPEHYGACLLFIFGQPFQNGPWSTSPNAEHYWGGYEPIRAYLDGERKKMGWDIPTVKKMVGHSDLLRDHWFSKSQWSFPTREVYETLQREAQSDAFRKEYDELRKEYDELRGYFDNSNSFTDLWKFDQLTTTELHPTVKPVEVCERGIVTTSQAGEIVLDVFLGSGSTLLACERLNRKCRAVEISAAFCAVTLQRWHDLTGLDPQRID